MGISVQTFQYNATNNNIPTVDTLFCRNIRCSLQRSINFDIDIGSNGNFLATASFAFIEEHKYFSFLLPDLHAHPLLLFAVGKNSDMI